MLSIQATANDNEVTGDTFTLIHSISLSPNEDVDTSPVIERLSPHFVIQLDFSNVFQALQHRFTFIIRQFFHHF